jgi:hypothetical protein
LIKERSLGGVKFWALVVDDYSDSCWSFSIKKRSDLNTKIINLLTDLKIDEIKIYLFAVMMVERIDQ